MPPLEKHSGTFASFHAIMFKVAGVANREGSKKILRNSSTIRLAIIARYSTPFKSLIKQCDSLYVNNRL